MTSFEDFKSYLPKYLSSQAERGLYEEIKSFPANIDSRFYTDFLKDEKSLFQGDGIRQALLVDFAAQTFRQAPAITLSNTCDIEISNTRVYVSNICLAPIMSLPKYEVWLKRTLNIDSERVANHLSEIRKQFVTQIFYLPKGAGLQSESLVWLDRISYCSSESIPRESLPQTRLFTLSNYGFYVFVTKLSMHFSRIKEAINRDSPLD